MRGATPKPCSFWRKTFIALITQDWKEFSMKITRFSPKESSLRVGSQKDLQERTWQVAYGEIAIRWISTIFGYVTLLTTLVKCFNGPEPLTALHDPLRGPKPSNCNNIIQ